MEETTEKSKLFEVKKVIIHPQQEDDSDLIKCLEEGYAIVEKLEQSVARGTKRIIYILRKDLSLSNDERDEYERLKKKEADYKQKMAIFVKKFGEGDIPEFASELVVNKITDFDFAHCYTQKNYINNSTDVVLTIKITDIDLYDYQHKKGL